MKLRTFTMLLCMAGTPVLSHGNVVHKNSAEAQKHLQEAPLPTGPALPFDVKLGGSFDLTDQNGDPRTEANPDGHMQLLFFRLCQLSGNLFGGPAPDGRCGR
jgi:cytochrome oxidase Cu insertion factor (SCO1/SenC/PrrC family)